MRRNLLVIVEIAIYFASNHSSMFWTKHGSSKLPCLAQNIGPTPPHQYPLTIEPIPSKSKPPPTDVDATGKKMRETTWQNPTTKNDNDDEWRTISKVFYIGPVWSGTPYICKGGIAVLMHYPAQNILYSNKGKYKLLMYFQLFCHREV